MKKLLLFSICLFVGFFSNAANWHPFPFSISYYSRPVSFGSFSGLGVRPSIGGPLVSGQVVEGMYLDLAIQNPGNSIRIRSNKFPDTDYSYNNDFANLVHQTSVLTNNDSSMVIWINKTVYGPNDTVVFYPKQQRIGNTSQILTKTFENVLGTMDSVRSISSGNRGFRWSKNFGILNLTVYDVNSSANITLIGSPAIAGSWAPFTGKPALPTVGDEFHFLRYNEGVKVGNGPFCPIPGYWSNNQEVRMKILEYPHQGNAAKMLVEKIESEPGATTGILYSDIVDTSAAYSWTSSSIVFQPPGTKSTASNLGSGYFIDNKGITMYYLNTGFIIDAWPVIHFFSCGLSPTNFIDNEGTMNSNGMCAQEILELTYPLYIKSQASCTMGTPLPPVTITSVSALSGLGMVQISPNPAKGSVRIQVPGMESESLSFELIHTNGKTTKGILQGNQAERTLNLSGFSSGLYILRISTGK